jgi:hypothetical protein
MELLELEMRARAIKALLNKNGEGAASAVPTATSERGPSPEAPTTSKEKV